MDKEPDKQIEKGKFPMWALVLAFLPSVFFLVFITFIRNWISSVSIKPTLYTIAVLSLASCIISSTILFKRRTFPSIVAGLALLILNTLIALFFGCTASISDMFQ
jgi:hypothetical protein